MCVFVSRPMKIVTFLRKSGETPKWVVDFLMEKSYSEKIMEIVEDFDEKSYNNNGKLWKSSCFHLSIFHFSFFYFFVCFPSFAIFILFFFFQSSAVAKAGENRREVFLAKLTIFFCENSILGPR